MNSRKIFAAILFIVFTLAIVQSCKDMGSPPPVQTGLSASSSNVTVVKGATTQITLSGGVTPYTVTRPPDPLKASVSLASSVLTIAGVDTGITSTVVADHKIPAADSVEISISILGTSAPVSFANKIQPIFNNQCTSSCHGSNGGLSLDQGTSYSHLVNVQAQSSCTSLRRVPPNDAANSVLYRKVSGAACGSQMPQGSSLSASDIALIRDWINQGANNN